MKGGSERLNRWTIRKIFGDAFDSIQAEVSPDRDQMSIYCILLPLDAPGIRRMSEHIGSTFERLVKLRERCVRGLTGGEEPSHMALSHILLYESAPLGKGQTPRSR